MYGSRCGPRLSEAAADKLKNRYVLMRSGVRDHEMESEKRLNIPITVRYILDNLETCVATSLLETQHLSIDDDSYSA